MPKDDIATISTMTADIDKYMDQIKALNVTYRNNVDKLRAIKGNKKKVDEKMDLLTQREDILHTYLKKKEAIRSFINRLALANQGLAALKEKEFKEVLVVFKEINGEFKEMGMIAERDELFDGAKARVDRDDPSRMNNSQLLDGALSIQVDNKNRLKEGLTMLTAAKQTGLETMGTLQTDREKMARIRSGLDEVDSELAISQKLISNVMKRIATDKVIIAFTFLVLAGVVGIIVYATLNPNQKIFNVPDAVKPSIPGVTESVSPTPSPSP